MSSSPKTSPASPSTSSDRLDRLPLGRLAVWSTPLAGLVGLLVFARLFYAWWLLAIHDPLWLDELHTDWHVATSLGDVVGRSLRWNQTPLFFIVEWLVTGWLGNAPWSLRLTSLLAMVGTVGVLIWLIAWRTGDWVAAVVVAVGFASIDWVAFYATEARPYALLMLVATIQLGVWSKRVMPPAVARQDSSGIRGAIIDCLLAVLLVAIHPVALVFLATQIVCHGVLLAVARPGWSWKGKWLRLSGSLCGLCLSMLWLVGLRNSLAHRELWYQVAEPSELMSWAIWLSVVWSVPLFVAVVTPRFTVANGQLRSAWWLFAFCCSGIVGLLICQAAGIFPIAHPRYAMMFLPGWALACGLALGSLRGPFLRLAMVSGIAILLWLAPRPELSAGGVAWRQPSTWFWRAVSVGTVEQWRREDWESVVEMIAAHRGQSQRSLLLLFSNVLEDRLLSRWEDDDLLRRELAFPLSRWNQRLIELGIVVSPRSTLSRPRFRPGEFSHVRPGDDVWLLVRAGKHASIVADILDELRSQEPWRKAPGEIRYFAVPGDVLVLIKLSR